MIVVGFGTSAPEMTVSAISTATGNPGIALGNAYGSNIANIALILGLTALIRPVQVHSRVLRSELPLLFAATALAGFQLMDGVISRLDAAVLLGAFAALLAWTLWTARRQPTDALAHDVDLELKERDTGAGRNTAWLVVGLVVLILSSRLLVWGAVNVAQQAGVSDLVIGLTIVAVGTSLPELASSIVAARRGEHDLAFGNILGSNLFNTLVVVGLAGAISPLPVAPELLARDLPMVAGLTLALLVFGYGFRGPGRINRIEGGLLVAAFVGYTLLIIAG
jgi:cation:H+ antiporter